jgi:hypothetical protein
MTQLLRQQTATTEQPQAQRPPAPPLPLARRWDQRQSLLLLALLAIWLFTRPWSGIWHDGRLYAAQAMHLLYPEQFKNDLFFLFGSQDKFTVFSPLYAAAIKAFGLDSASRLLQVAGSALWLGGAYYLLSGMLRGVMLWVALAWLLLLPTDYDPFKSFCLIEPYLTPRIFAEALTMLAIACLLRGKWRWLGLLLPLSLATHPLVALAGVLLGLLYLASGGIRRKLPLLAAGVLVLAGGVALDLIPVQRLLQTMDAEWYQQVARMTSAVTWDGWTFGHMASRCAVSFSLVLMAAWLSSGWRARFYYCVALAGALSLLATWLGTSVFHNLLVMQIQPWRAMWLVQLVAVIAMCALLSAFWHRGRVFQLLLAACMLGVFARDSYGGMVTMLAGAALCWYASQAEPKELSNRIYGWACCLLLTLSTVWLAQVDAQSSSPLGVSHWNYVSQDFIIAPLEPMQWSMTLLRLGGGALLGMALMLGIWHFAGRRTVTGWLLAVGLVAGALGGAVWLGQGYSNRQLNISEAGVQAARSAFVPLIPPQATVYWEDELRATWFVLQRSSYGSTPQIYGMVFNRGTATEGMRRLNRLRRMGASDVVWRKQGQSLDDLQDELRTPNTDDLAYVCADVALDFVVLAEKLGTHAIASARDPVYRRSYFLYDCARLRANLASH